MSEETFDPSWKLTVIGGKDYLDVKYRILWFRSVHPKGCISPELISVDPPIAKTVIYDGEGNVLAAAHAGALEKANSVWSGRAIEKAETASIGRALAHAGFGTEDAVRHGAQRGKPSVNESKKALGQGDKRLVNGNGSNHTAQPSTGERSRETLNAIFTQVEVWFDDESEAGKKKHMMNVIAQLERNDLLNSTTPIPQVVEAIIANRREKTAQQTAQA